MIKYLTKLLMLISNKRNIKLISVKKNNCLIIFNTFIRIIDKNPEFYINSQNTLFNFFHSTISDVNKIAQ